MQTSLWKKLIDETDNGFNFWRRGACKAKTQKQWKMNKGKWATEGIERDKDAKLKKEKTAITKLTQFNPAWEMCEVIGRSEAPIKFATPLNKISSH